MTLRHWEVERTIAVTHRASLPMKSEFFFTRRGAESYKDFASSLGGLITIGRIRRRP